MSDHVDGAPRVRFAPAPTGSLHLGSARSALFNWLFARSTGGTLVLRIEDTDLARSSEQVIDQILSTFAWLGINFDEGPFRQSERLGEYRSAAERLFAEGRAYYCDQTPEQVQRRARERGRPGYDGFSRDRGLDPGPGRVLRFRTPDEGETAIDDVVRGEVRFPHADLEDFVVLRSDGSPVFLVANALDDAEMGITHVIRGEDLLNTTPKVLLLRDALGLGPPPTYAHLPLIVGADGKKLSKRRDDVAVESYRERGYLPAAMVNYLALLGWGPRDGVEVRPIAEIAEQFRLSDITSSPARFDDKKLDHVNAEHLRAQPVAAFVAASTPFIEHAPWFDRAQVDQASLLEIAPLVQERCRTLAEVPDMIDFLFLAEPDIEAASWEAVFDDGGGVGVEVLRDAQQAWTGIDWTAEALHESLRALGESRDLKLGKAQAPVRVAVTGRRVGPPLFESLELLGREATLARLAAAEERAASAATGAAS